MSSPDCSNPIPRREFIGVIVGILGGPGPGNLSRSDDNEKSLDPSYLEKGLVGMARSQGWFNAHLGAAVLAGYYLCKENNLSQGTVASIQQQLDALIRIHQDQFAPFPPMDGDKSLIETLPSALGPTVEGGLRAHGHAVIYTALATRALRDMPHMAVPPLVRQLRAHTSEIGRMKPKVPKISPDFADSQAMVHALFDNLARFKPLLGRPTVRRPNFTHMTTHTEALMTLETLGYPELAKTGGPGLQAHIEEPVPDFDHMAHPVNERRVTLEEVMNERYWGNDENHRQWKTAWDEKTNPNGYWVAFGHLFKVLYSYQRLIARMQDKNQVRLCGEILLERYINANVVGG